MSPSSCCPLCLRHLSFTELPPCLFHTSAQTSWQSSPRHSCLGESYSYRIAVHFRYSHITIVASFQSLRMTPLCVVDLEFGFVVSLSGFGCWWCYATGSYCPSWPQMLGFFASTSQMQGLQMHATTLGCLGIDAPSPSDIDIAGTVDPGSQEGHRG